jgi:hypothetical protein
LRQIKTLIFSAQAPLQFADATTTAIPRLRCHRLPSLTSVRMARMAVSRMIAAKQPTPEIVAGNQIVDALGASGDGFCGLWLRCSASARILKDQHDDANHDDEAGPPARGPLHLIGVNFLLQCNNTLKSATISERIRRPRSLIVQVNYGSLALKGCVCAA